jgi:hypothetical protein
MLALLFASIATAFLSPASTTLGLSAAQPSVRIRVAPASAALSLSAQTPALRTGARVAPSTAGLSLSGSAAAFRTRLPATSTGLSISGVSASLKSTEHPSATSLAFAPGHSAYRGDGARFAQRCIGISCRGRGRCQVCHKCKSVQFFGSGWECAASAGQRGSDNDAESSPYRASCNAWRNRPGWRSCRVADLLWSRFIATQHSSSRSGFPFICLCDFAPHESRLRANPICNAID